MTLDEFFPGLCKVMEEKTRDPDQEMVRFWWKWPLWDLVREKGLSWRPPIFPEWSRGNGCDDITSFVESSGPVILNETIDYKTGPLSWLEQQGILLYY